ncbi:pyrroline-5-carboxylate reductase [Salinibacillus xinjiangensis]|uniref:Pyrroline-5-carboxylate reductase n=1 Tax=Salinibacillus xinjiangensis TaxID=1229268 RepID=A0A6G1X1Z2_9BACI|nr:pyrroline-5-carboxylate reductase [Salinibacillus xinjiangensis]MRG84954.1 pyrroline-5-carboxylate reductase [Salinibacillus xinjiangensis]
MEQTIGFIGCGKMAQAMIGGMLQDEQIKPNQIIASSSTEKTLQKVTDKFEIRTTLDNQEVAAESDILFLAVSPKLYKNVIQEARTSVKSSVIIVTIAAGVSIEHVQHTFQSNVKVVRTMPNTPSLVQEGMSAMCASDEVTSEELGTVQTLFETFGKVELINEEQMDAIPAISGSSPAYVYMMIEAMADGGVRQGLTRDQAYRLASQAVAGAAKMVLETGMHPGELKDQVTSPGGSTITAVSELEKQQFRGAVQSAMEQCSLRVKELSE